MYIAKINRHLSHWLCVLSRVYIRARRAKSNSIKYHGEGISPYTSRWLFEDIYWLFDLMMLINTATRRACWFMYFLIRSFYICIYVIICFNPKSRVSHCPQVQELSALGLMPSCVNAAPSHQIKSSINVSSSSVNSIAPLTHSRAD